MNREERATLRRAVERARRLLEDEVADQLEGTFGILPSGKVLDDALGDPTIRQRLLELVTHHQAAGETAKEAVERATRELAFTTLNRFVALKMAERRGLVRECISKGLQSDGIRELADCAPGLHAALPDGGYRLLLEAVMDEISIGLSALFDRRAPAGLIWSRPNALDELLDILNAAELAGLWEQDETIGWVYQYFNPKEEREAMRKASAAPRNSREFAVRNQFFTPRYVVAFLTDNTLGRIWYEMRRGDTALKESCRYLVRRPSEVFLAPGEPAPQSKNDEADLTQEELHRHPVYIQHRPKKDPRDFKVLDPACGSGHFLLYAFGLLERIYEEAWADAESPTSGATGRTLREDYGSIDELRRAAPKLIIEHNLHGIDIDQRTVQIAALALWLRAQKAWQGVGLKPAERPQVAHSNTVTAEPMPGEDDMRRELVDRLRPRVLGQLVDLVFERMTLAGEAGSLLKIEEDIKDGIAEARKQWLESSEGERQLLFPGMGPARPVQQKLRFDLTGVDDERFWEEAESRILESLKTYSERAENGRAFRRRLFAEDAARGFAFIDICRQRYDVVLMNPPFGDASLPSKTYIEDNYADTKRDVYKAFVECFQARLVPAGYIGIISSRTGFFLSQSEDWRTRIVLRLFRPLALADLGIGVLDAMVEVAAYVLRNLSEQEARDLTLSLVPVLKKVSRDRQDRFSLPKWQAARDGLKRHQAIAELGSLEAAGFTQQCPGDIVRYVPIWHRVKSVSAPPPTAAFSPMICIRVLTDDDKAASLANAFTSSDRRRVFTSDPAGFSVVPGSPFSYWVTQSLRNLFRQLPPMQGNARHACVTNQVGDDFRYYRASWEVPPLEVNRYRRWVPLAKGGSYSPFYADLHLLVDWQENRGTYRGFIGTEHRPLERPASANHFFRPGITWPRRTDGLSFRILPAGAMFSNKGPAILFDGDNPDVILAACSVLCSTAFGYLLAIQLGRVSLAQSYEVGLIQVTPFPEIPSDSVKRLAHLAGCVWREEWNLDTSTTTSHAFRLPALNAVPGSTLVERAVAWTASRQKSREAIDAIRSEIDILVFGLYRLEDEDRVTITASLSTEAGRDSGEDDVTTDDEEEDGATDYVAAAGLVADLLDYIVGVTYGRHDVRLALDPSLAPAPPHPCDPLPVCPAGMLVGSDGMPAKPDGIVSEEWLRSRPDANTQPPQGSVAQPSIKDTQYPLPIAWDGILVDDPGLEGNQPHRDDIVRRVREVLNLLWKDRVHEIEREACEMLGVPTLRDYLRKPSGFFDDHLKRYSKSRRKAPIYWPLATASGGYTVWVYYHRLTEDTLYRVVSDYVSPKISQVEDRITQREGEHKSAQGRDAPRLAKELSELTSLLQELKELRHELLRVAQLPYRPNLNDGVQITAASLWRLFRLPRWRAQLEGTWQALEPGKYDWAHLAYAIWPERVRETCRRDRSIAIAHGLEELYEEEVSTPQRPARRRRGQAG